MISYRKILDLKFKGFEMILVVYHFDLLKKDELPLVLSLLYTGTRYILRYLLVHGLIGGQRS